MASVGIRAPAASRLGSLGGGGSVVVRLGTPGFVCVSLWVFGGEGVQGVVTLGPERVVRNRGTSWCVSGARIFRIINNSPNYVCFVVNN